MMCQPQTITCETIYCDTIKANARLRRSRQWKDQSENNIHAGVNIDGSPNASRTVHKKSRRKRRPTKKEQQLETDFSDASTASTAPSSDESFSSSAPAKQPKSKSNRNNGSTKRRKRSKKSKMTRPKVVNIPPPEPTEEEKAQYVALDCEMVGVGPGGFQSRLARVSIVNWDRESIYDVHVKVVEAVTDYRTFVSGITEEDLLSEEAVTFDEAQLQVAELIHDKILVGHGLKNDFKVLELSHPWFATRDTAKYEPFMKPIDPYVDFNYPIGATHAPKKLKVLAKDKLGMVIQEEGKPHCPEDDAVAALELYKKHRGKWEKAVSWKIEKTRSIVTQRTQ